MFTTNKNLTMHISTPFKNSLFVLRKVKKQVVLFALSSIFMMQAFAQIPLNDDPCLDPNFPGTGAINLIATAACSYSTFSNVDASATAGVSNPPCGTFLDADVWFTVTVPVGATSIVIDTRSGPAGGPTQPALVNGALAAYTATGTCPTLAFTNIGCNDNNGGNLMPQLTLTATPGTVVYIRMWGVGGQAGTFGICVTANIPPANNECVNAQSLTVNADLLCGVVTGGTTNNSTQSSTLPNPTCGVLNAWNDDVWFSFVATGVAHRVSLLNVAGGSTNMVMVVYSGTCAALAQVACLNGNTLDIGGLTVGNTYYVRVYTNVTSNATANFNICIGTPPPPPANDECTNAVSLTVNPTYTCTAFTAGTTVSATQSSNSPVPSCSTTGINDDVWYSFVATGTGHRVTLTNVLPANAMGINVYSGTCTGLTEIGCSTTGTLNVTGLTVGSTYLVRIFTTSATVGTTSAFNICVGTPPPPPANDECLNAISIPVNADFNCALITAGTTVSATQSVTTPIPTCSATGINDDVWYSFVTTGTAHRITLTGVTPVNAMGIAAYSGTCGALVQVGCSVTGTLNLAGLSPNTTYIVRVFTTSATAFVESNFNICVGTPPPPPPNDNCIGAISATVNPNYLCGVVTAGTTTSATLSVGAPAPTCTATGTEDDDVWFSFVATNTSHRISLLNIVGTSTALASVIYSGSCTALTQINCSTTNLYNVGGLTIGNTYYIRIYTNTPVIAQEVNFNLCIGTPPPPPANDNCSGAISLTVNANQLCGVTTAGTTAGATQSPTAPTPTCSPANGWDDDVWYSFVAASNNHTVSLLNVSGLSTNMLTTVYSGTCGALIQIACTGVDPNIINLNTLTVGNTYYVRVQTELTGVDANFSICVGTPGPGAVCGSGVPFCSTQGVSYPSETGQPSLGTIDCLFTTPNPTWFYFQVSTAGNLQFQISQTNAAGVGIDVDFAAWGPFTSQAAGCTSIAANPVPTIDCSYSTAAIETVDIPNALVGQWYVVLITNFNGGAGSISFNTTPTSTGSTNCNIVCNTTANNNGPVCLGGTFNLTATALVGATTYAWTGPNGFTSTAQNPTGITAPTTAGNYVYNVTTTSGSVSCSATTNLIVVNTPVAPVVISPVTYCQGATATALTATALPNHTLLWYTAAIGGVGSTIAPIPSTASIGSTTYFVSQKIGLCEGPRAPIAVNIIVSTTPAVTVVSPVTYCQGATAVSLSASATPATGATLLWYTAATGGVGSATAPIPSTTASGSTTYYVSQIISSCEGPRVPIIVNVTAYSPSPVTTSPVNYCQGNTAVPLSATGTNLLWYTAPSGGTGSATAPTPNTAIAATTTYYVTQTSNGCESLRVPVVVNVFANPATPIVISPVIYCQNTTATVLTASGTGLTWYTVPTGGTALPGAPTPSTTTVGNTTYYVQANNGTCFSTRASITVTVNETPAAPTVISPVTYCQLATPTALTAVGTNLLWYTTSTGGTGSTTAPTPSTTTVGTTNYYVTSTIGTCESLTRSLIAVVINETPLIPTVITPVNYCQNVLANPLTASVNVGTLLWYTTATGGTGSATAPTPSTATAGSVTYYVSGILGTCEGPRTAIVVTVTATPALPTVISPVTYCTNVTPTALTATGTSLLWYTTLTGGTGSTTAPTPSTATAGTTPYYVSQSTTGVVCEGPRALINVVVNPRPAAPTVITPLLYCQNFNAPILGATGANLLWYNVATGGTGSSTAPTPSTSTVGSTSYYVSQSALTCEGARSAIVVNINPALNVNAGVDRIMARGDTIQLAGTSTSVGATYLWTANITPLALTSATILNPTANPIFTTIYTLRVSDPTGLCPFVTDDIRVEVVQSCINIKNAFTPNGDGINDTWFIYDQNFCLTNPGGAKVTVFNRYGSRVFESKDYANKWDGTYNGKPLPDGTYYAIIEFTLFDGSKQFKRTDVTILR
jgi:gliding motility-associated-like protein